MQVQPRFVLCVTAAVMAAAVAAGRQDVADNRDTDAVQGASLLWAALAPRAGVWDVQTGRWAQPGARVTIPQGFTANARVCAYLRMPHPCSLAHART